MTGRELISAFREGKLEIDCAQMQLTQAASADPITYSGRGYIRLTSDGQLEFKIYPSAVVHTDGIKHIKNMFSPESGKLYAPSDLYELSAIDQLRNTWTAEKIIPHPNWMGPETLLHVQGALQVVHSRGGHFANPGQDHYLRLHFFDDADVPCTAFSRKETLDGVELERDIAKFTALGCDFTVTRASTEIVVQVQSKFPFKPHFHTRIAEALQFLLARSLYWRVLVKSVDKQQSLELSSARKKSLKTNLDPPLAPGYEGYYEHSWPLFERYLDYVTRTNDGEYWHTCTYHLHNACEASANSIDAWAIGVCVAVEGISSLIDVAQTDSEKKEKKEISKSLRDFIDSQGWGETLSKRAKGLLGQLQNLRVIDRLEPLHVTGHVDGTHVRAWSTLRNKQAHPKHADLRNLSTGDIQGALDLISKTTVLMYHIVFHLIGYAGKYVDYGTHRYPVKNYPLEIPQVQQPADGADTASDAARFSSVVSMIRNWGTQAKRALCALVRCYSPSLRKPG